MMFWTNATTFANSWHKQKLNTRGRYLANQHLAHVIVMEMEDGVTEEDVDK